jgi:hypothetical protein
MKVIHDLSALSKEEIIAYLREVSTFIGLDPDLNALDTIWMRNENGPGQSLVVYMRRGTAEILRNHLGINVEDLTDHMVGDSIVFRAVGKDKKNRQEIATGSKSIKGLTGKALDDAIMTASTRALRRLTAQYTTLGLLDESEVVAVVGDTPNLAGSVQLSSNPVPPVFAAPTVQPNNAPGKISEAPQPAPTGEAGAVGSGAALDLPLAEPSLGRPEQVAAVWAQVAAKDAAKEAAIPPSEEPLKPTESVVTPAPEADKKADKPKRARKPKEVVLDGPEPEVVSAKADIPESQRTPTPVPTQAVAAVPEQANPAPSPSFGKIVEQEGMPSAEQMAEYRKKVSAVTAELPATDGMGSVQRMRAFITKRTGSAPQNMTIAQWTNFLSFLDTTIAASGVLGVVKIITSEIA